MRRGVVAGVKILVAVGLVAFVVLSGKIDFNNLTRLFSSPGYFIAAFGVLTLQTAITAMRLKRLLRVHGDDFPFWMMLKITYIGAAFDLVATTSVGGDAVKAFYVAREIPEGRRTESVSVLFVDRLMGLLGLLSLTLVAAVWSLNSLWSDAAVKPYLIGLLCVCAALLMGSFILFSRRLHDWKPLRWLIGKLPFGQTINRAYSSMRAFRERPVILLEGWAWAVSVHVLGCVAGYLLARGLGMQSAGGAPAEWSLFFVALMMSNFVSSFAPFGGIGAGQVAYTFVFERVARLLGGADLATLIQLAFALVKAPGLIAWITAKKESLAAIESATQKPAAPDPSNAEN
ncbi:MAG: lysylphosphatidylglycerol synthase transmembrane domain-containing protein [Planctomycetota bacterium]